jgi:SPP1 family predicted phage head-tail adaptor
MRTLVTIQQQNLTPDNQGGQDVAWTTFTTMWARVEAVGGREGIKGGQQTAFRGYKITGPYKSGILPTMRAMWFGTVHNIVDIDNISLTDRFTVLRADLGVPS